MLTFTSIMYNKGDNSAFWLPELTRTDLSKHFFDIQDQISLWEFLEKDFVHFAFDEKSAIDKRLNKVDLNILNSKNGFNPYSLGRLFIGPIRFL